MDNTPNPADHGQRRLVWVDGARHLLSLGVASELRNARRRQGLSFRAAAKRTGVSAGNICKLEHSQRAPSYAVAELLIDGLKLEPVAARRLMAEARPYAGRSWVAPDEREQDLDLTG